MGNFNLSYSIYDYIIDLNTFPASANTVNPLKKQKIFGFLVFSGGKKCENWPEMS